ncbi:MAG: amidase family protein, partial [Desulfobacterales bacterium]|nr:amidase family protein [Desulfobacterales bacterium]
GETVFWEDADPEVEKAVRECGRVFETLGASVRSIPFPEAEEARSLNPRGLIIAAEAYTLNQKWVEEHYDQLDPVVAARILLGKTVSAPEYLQNLRAWKGLRARVTHALRDIDALLVPATILPARPFVDLDADLDVYTTHNLAYLRNTAIGNILNLCGLAVPCGYTRQGLPVGLMIYGKTFHEEMVLRVGYAFQQATDWHRRTPDLSWTAKG